MKNLSIKLQLVLFLSIFSIYLAITSGTMRFILPTFSAVITAICADSIFLWLKEKKFVISESSVITGLIISFVLYERQLWWNYCLASILAISSKHLLRLNKRHIFNPAAFGILLSMIIFGATTQWKGTYQWYILAPFGVYFSYKIRKLDLLLSYFVTTFFLFGTRALFAHQPLSSVFGFLSFFFIFIMLIEPKTTPVRMRQKIVFGMGAGVLIFLLTHLGVSFDVELASLLLMNASGSYIRGQKTLFFKSGDDNGRSVFRSRKPWAKARGASLLDKI